MAQGKTDNLEAFAKRIATRIRKSSGGSDSMERLICRLLTGDDQKVASTLASKWVEWLYGKPTERVEMTVNYTEALTRMRAKREQ